MNTEWDYKDHYFEYCVYNYTDPSRNRHDELEHWDDTMESLIDVLVGRHFNIGDYGSEITFDHEDGLRQINVFVYMPSSSEFLGSITVRH